jgi:hypothetical protein
VVAKATQLSALQQQKLLMLLRKYDNLFKGILGKLNSDPVDNEEIFTHNFLRVSFLKDKQFNTHKQRP